MSKIVDLHTEQLTLAELQRVIANLVDYLEVEVSRRPMRSVRHEMRIVPKIVEED